jgi:hypothetical protein
MIYKIATVGHLVLGTMITLMSVQIRDMEHGGLLVGVEIPV